MRAYVPDGWGVLGDRTRRTIFELLADRAQTVGELAAVLPVSRSAVSQHLKVLKDANLVTDEPDGNRRIYHVDPVGAAALRAELDNFWTKTLAAYKVTAENHEEGATVSTPIEDTTVRAEVVIDAPIERAFDVFTARFGDFKLKEHNILGAEIAETVFERHVGGHIYDRAVDGSECRWARVLEYEPPNRVLFSWDLSPQWQVEPDHDKTSEVEVRFIAETDQRTRVELEHRNIDRHGEGWQAVVDGSAEGWPLYLSGYVALFAEEN